MLSLLASLVLAQTPAPVPQGSVTPGSVISQMMLKYNKAVSVVGTVTLNQKANEKTIVTRTVLQYEKPSKFYLFQELGTQEKKTCLVTSDGKLFSYSMPEMGTIESAGKRLVERVDQAGILQDVRMIYGAAIRSVVDRNVPMEIAIGRTEDLRFMRDQWVQPQLEEKDGLYRITGQWREYSTTIITGRFLMVIDKEFNLKQYAVVERRQFQTPDGQKTPVFDLTSDWIVDLKIDAACDPKLFRVVR